MKASKKKVRKREYRYRLYSTPPVTCAPEVAEFIYGHSKGVISFEDSGDVSATFDGLSGPYRKEAVRIMRSEELFADGFSVVLLNDDIAAPLFQWENYAVVSHGWQWVRRLELEGTDNPGIPILIYLTLTAVVNYELHKYLPDDFPHELIEQGPFGWASLILSGRLPFESLGKLKGLKESEQDVDVFLSAVESVLGAIAENHPSLHAVPSSEPDPRQQPPHEVKAGLGMGISLKAAESAEEPRVTEADEMVIEIADYFEELGAELEEEDKEVLTGIIESELPMRSEEDGLYLLMHSIGSEEFGVISSLQFFLEASDHPVSRELLARLPFQQLDDLENDYAFKKALERDDQREREKGDVARETKPPPPTPETSTTTSDAEIKAKPPETGNYGFHSDTGAPEDALGYSDYAKALAAVICDKTTGMPLTLGICAPWGRGKSALMKFVKDEIEIINQRIEHSSEPGKHDKRRAEIIDFNAWRYSRAEQVWSGFIAEIMRELEQGLNRIQKLKLALKLNKSRDLPVVYNLIAFVASVVILATLAIMFAPGNWLSTLGLASVGAIAFYRKVFKGAWKLATSPAAERITRLSKLPDYASRLDPIHKILDDIKTITEVYQKSAKVDRFVVFIDDIDRCKPGKIMETLEAIKHLLDLEHFVFVVAMDTRVVRHAIGVHYKFMSEDHQEWEAMGRFYLEKMIQVPFHLPELSPAQRLKLNEKVITPHLKEIVLEMKPTRMGLSTKGPTVIVTSENGDVIESRTPAEEPTPTTQKPERDAPIRSLITSPEHLVIKSILEIGDFDISPRLLKRFINVYLIARHLLITERKRVSISVEEPIPDSFIKWLALSVRFPSVAKSLVAWLKSNNWSDPFGDNVFGNDGCFRFGKVWTEKTPTGWTDAAFVPFDNLSVPDLHAFGKVLRDMNMDWDEVRDTLHITNCFNLVLE